MGTWGTGTITLGFYALEFYKEKKLNPLKREDIDKAVFEIKDFIKSFMCKDMFTYGDSNFDIAFLPYYSSKLDTQWVPIEEVDLGYPTGIIFSKKAGKIEGFTVETCSNLFFNITCSDRSYSAVNILLLLKDLLCEIYNKKKLIPHYCQFSINDCNDNCFYTVSPYFRINWYKPKATHISEEERYIQEVDDNCAAALEFEGSMEKLKKLIYGE